MRSLPFLPQNSQINPVHIAGVALLGLVFPEIGSLLCASHSGELSLSGVLTAQCSNPILWLLDMVPVALIVAAWKSALQTNLALPLIADTNVSFLRSRIEELETEISQRDLRLEETSLLLGMSSQIRQSLLETITQPCFILDRDGKITEANEAFWRLTPAGTNPYLSFYADLILDVQTHSGTEEPSACDLGLGVLSQSDVHFVTFHLRTDLPCHRCQIRQLGEHGGPIGSLWMLTPDESIPAPICAFSIEVPSREHASFALSVPEDLPNDSLTGFTSVHIFRERVAEEWERSIRKGTPLSLVLVDLVNFRLFNQRYGRPAGDQALVSLAAAIKSCARKTDCIARYNGDVFAALLPETEQSDAMKFADRLRKAVEMKAEAGLAITVHIACTTLAENKTLAEFGESAGRALAHAKNIRGSKTVHSNDLMG